MFRLSLATLAVICAISLVPPPARAQHLTQGDLQVGMRVRVSAPRMAGETATLLAHRGDSLLLLSGSNDTLALALASVNEIEVSVGTRMDRRGGAVAGVGIGGLVGAGIGAFTALADRDAGFPTMATMTGMAGGAIIGLVSGAIMGAGRTDDWRRVVDDRRPIAASVAPHVDRSGVGLSVSMPIGRW